MSTSVQVVATFASASVSEEKKLTFAQVVAAATAAATAAAPAAAPEAAPAQKEQKFKRMAANQSYAKAVKAAESKAFDAKGACGFVCRHSFVHCAYVGCFNALIAKMEKPEGEEYVSADGELYFCIAHNAEMSNLYGRYKKLVDWHPSKLWTYQDIDDDYIYWALPQSISLREHYSSLLQERSVPSTGHLYYEELLRKQLDFITKMKNGIDELDEKIRNGYIPPKYYHNTEIDWDECLSIQWE